MTDHRQVYRLVIVAIALNLAFCGLIAKLVFLHLTPNEIARGKVERVRRYTKELIVPRGRLFDGSVAHNILALNVAVKNVCADPSQITKGGKAELVVRHLAGRLQVDAGLLTKRLSRPNAEFAYVRKCVPDEKADQIKQLNLTGVFFEDGFTRYYPLGSFMCHVLGFVNDEGVGSAGVEQAMDKYLRGCPGLVEGKLDGKRKELYLQRLREVPPENGADVFLAVDQNIQYVVEKAIEEGMQKNQARGAWAIVQRIRTGEILAMASMPAYDLNDFRRVTEDARFNRAIGMNYEPGSTMKAVTIAAALNEGIVTPATVFDCENGNWFYEGKVLRDFHPYGNLTVADIVKKSSNIGSAKIALLLGSKKLEEYLRAFGIGGRLGFDLAGEEAGILSPSSKWSKISPTRIAIGQGVAVTALQMLGVYSAIANDGFLMKPYVVQRVVKSDGTVLMQAEPEVLNRAIRGETAAIMRSLLWRVTEEGGTGKRACVDGYKVAGKTGTAQKVIHGVYSDTAYVASFVGFLPAEQPEVAIVVVIDEPQPVHVGGAVAAPVFGQIAEQVARYLDIPAEAYQMADLSDSRLQTAN